MVDAALQSQQDHFSLVLLETILSRPGVAFGSLLSTMATRLGREKSRAPLSLTDDIVTRLLERGDVVTLFGHLVDHNYGGDLDPHALYLNRRFFGSSQPLTADVLKETLFDYINHLTVHPEDHKPGLRSFNFFLMMGYPLFLPEIVSLGKAQQELVSEGRILYQEGVRFYTP